MRSGGGSASGAFFVGSVQLAQQCEALVGTYCDVFCVGKIQVYVTTVVCCQVILRRLCQTRSTSQCARSMGTGDFKVCVRQS